MFLSESERIEILIMIGYGDRKRTQDEVCALFNETHPDRDPISQSTVSRIQNKFNEYGHVRDVKRSGRPSSTNEDMELDILLTVKEDPHSSLTKLQATVDLSKTTLWRLLRRNKYHPYKVQPLQELTEGDGERRLQFCEEINNFCDEDPNFLSSLLFSDESTFCLNGEVQILVRN